MPVPKPCKMLLASLVLTWAGFAQAAPAGLSAPADTTDQPIWRATHGPLLTIAHAGNRLVVAGDRGIILVSDDQGVSWTRVQSGTDELLTSSVFTSATEGWVVGQDSTILHTADAGAHWTTQSAAPGKDQALFSVASLGPDHLIATGAYALALETTDAATWAPVKLPSMDEDYHLNCVIGRGQDVLATGEAGHAFLRHDAAWAAMPVPYDGSQFGCLPGADGAMYSFGLRGSLFVSTLAVPAWKRIDTGEQRSIFGGVVLASGSIALVGGSGLVAVLDTHTDKLTPLPSPTGASLSGVAETPDGTLVIVGDDGLHRLNPKAAVSVDATQ